MEPFWIIIWIYYKMNDSRIKNILDVNKHMRANEGKWIYSGNRHPEKFLGTVIKHRNMFRTTPNKAVSSFKPLYVKYLKNQQSQYNREMKELRTVMRSGRIVRSSSASRSSTVINTQTKNIMRMSARQKINQHTQMIKQHERAIKQLSKFL